MKTEKKTTRYTRSLIPGRPLRFVWKFCQLHISGAALFILVFSPFAGLEGSAGSAVFHSRFTALPYFDRERQVTND
jgi:hypothetical protein